MADRITGADEKSMRADAQALVQIVRQIKGPAPMADPEHSAEAYVSGFKDSKHKPRQYGPFTNWD